MARMVTIYVLFHDGRFRNAYASFSELMRDKHMGSCCTYQTFHREDY